MKFKLATIIKRSVVLAAIVAAMGSATMAGEAKALNPDQNTVPGIVNPIYNDLVRFWGPNPKPAVGYYGYPYGDYWATACNPAAWTGKYHNGAQGFACGNSVYLDHWGQLGNISSYGDGSVAFWFAHEFGHVMENQLHINWTGSKPYHELLADCFAGMYFRYGIWTSRWLNNYNDLAEARNQISVLPWDDLHGSAQRRLNAFNYGLTQTKWWGCTSGAGVYY